MIKYRERLYTSHYVPGVWHTAFYLNIIQPCVCFYSYSLLSMTNTDSNSRLFDAAAVPARRASAHAAPKWCRSSAALRFAVRVIQHQRWLWNQKDREGEYISEPAPILVSLRKSLKDKLIQRGVLPSYPWVHEQGLRIISEQPSLRAQPPK